MGISMLTATEAVVLNKWSDRISREEYKRVITDIAQAINDRIEADMREAFVVQSVQLGADPPPCSLATDERMRYYGITQPLSWRMAVSSGMHYLDGEPSRDSRFNALRAEGKKLGEINAILEAEGFSEVSGEGVMPCPTKSHEIVRENKGAKQMIGELP